MDLDPTTTKYLIKATMNASGVVEKPDVIGAIFGQTEGLLGDELDLRDLQKSGRIGRIEVDVDSKQGQTEGHITLPSSLDKAETAILAAALESIDRIGPCQANVEIDGIDDVRESKRSKVADRAKELLQRMGDEGEGASGDLVNEVKEAVRIEELVAYGSERLPAGPNVSSSSAIVVVEGRSDVANLLTNGIKNAIATEGTSIPKTINDLSKEKVVTAFVDGDRGGELLLKELLQTADVDFVARAPESIEVEELTHKQIMKAMRNKLPAQQFIEEHGITELGGDDGETSQAETQQTSQQEQAEQEPAEPEPEKDTKPDRDKPKGRRKEKEEEEEEEEPEEEAPVQEPPEPEADPEARASTGAQELETYKAKLGELSGDLEGVLLDTNGGVVDGPLAVRDLADRLKKTDGNVVAVVFDGVITQRLLDIATEKGIQTVVGVKMGNVTKQPADVDVYTRDDL